MSDVPLAGELVASRVYSARCFVCAEVHEIARIPADEKATKIERCMRREGWRQGSFSQWVCPVCMNYKPLSNKLEEVMS